MLFIKVQSEYQERSVIGKVCEILFCHFAAPERLRVRQHCLILLKFFFFNVILVASDIGSDILTARNFFATKNNFWASLTLLFVFMPFLARIVIYLVDLAKCLSYNVGRLKVDRSRLKIQKQEFPYLIWHFPLLHPIRYFI